MTDSYSPEPETSPDGEVLRGNTDRRSPMDKDEYASILAAEIEAARDGDRTSYSKDRERALNYYLGEMPDTKAPVARSKAMSRDVADTIDWILPGLMRVFFSSDEVGTFLPTGMEDKEQAEQATHYINFKFLTELDGYNLCWDAFQDGLLMRLGVVKCYWDESPEYRVESYSGLTDDALVAVLNDPAFSEVLEHATREEAIVLPGAAEPETVRFHDCKVRLIKRPGRVVAEALPPEEFLIDADSTRIDEEKSRFLCHRHTLTRSELVEQGFDRDKVESLPVGDDADDEPEAQARRDEFVVQSYATAKLDPSQERIQVYDCYAKVDYDGDGIAEWTHCVMAGGMTGHHILAEPEEWSDPLPFADFNPFRIAHRWQGRSIADQTMDIQQVKTVLLRGTLDNIYENNNPQKVVVENEILNPDELINPTFNGNIRVKSRTDAVVRLQPNFIAPDTYNMMTGFDDMIAKRTGVSRQTMALDPETLQNQSATAAQLQNDSAYSKIELIARNYAEGMRALFSILLKLYVKHQNIPDIIRLRNEFVTIDPSPWNAEMDVSIDVGLGTGSSERDAIALGQILSLQKEIVGNFGPANPFVKWSQVHNTLSKLVKSAGLRNPDEFFTDVSDEEVGKWLEAQQGQKPDPKMAEAEGRLQIEQAKLQASLQADQAKMQSDLQIAQVKLQSEQAMAEHKAAAEHELRLKEIDAKIALQREEMAARIELEREKIRLNHEARLAEMAAEAELKRMQIAAGFNAPGDEGNIVRPQ